MAQGSRILAAGLGAGTMFGIVTVMGLDNPATGATTSPVATSADPVLLAAPAPVPIRVVIHRVPPAVAANPAPTSSAVEPVQLTANPVVRTITVPAASASTPQSAPAPAATTRGSN